MSERRGVLFDVDGVLIDSYLAHFESWKLLAAEIGRTYSERDFVAGFGRTSRENIAEQWSDGSLTSQDIQQLDDRKESLFRELIRTDFPAMDGAADLIRDLHRAGFGIAVGSSGPPENVELVLERLNVASLVECRITARDVTRGKPDPQVFLLAAQGLQLPPTVCCVIEDAPAGLLAGHAAGCVCIGFASTGRTPAELSTAEFVINSLRELTPTVVRQVIDQGRSLS